MHINDDYIANVNRLSPSGTNSTMFTECCGCAICADEAYCSQCGRKVIGWDAASNGERHWIRWTYATALWRRK